MFAYYLAKLSFSFISIQNFTGLSGLARADDYEQVKQVCEYYSDYKPLFENSGNSAGEKTLEDKFFEHEVCQAIWFGVPSPLLSIFAIFR